MCLTIELRFIELLEFLIFIKVDRQKKERKNSKNTKRNVLFHKSNISLLAEEIGVSTLDLKDCLI